jgi:hypothetical protein
MTVRAIDNNNDWLYGHNIADLKSGIAELQQNLKTRLQHYKYDCFYDFESGIDYGRIFDYNTPEAEIRAELGNCILGTEGIIGIDSITVNLDRKNRILHFSCSINTICGNIEITN